jgi:hypothetical protein
VRGKAVAQGMHGHCLVETSCIGHLAARPLHGTGCNWLRCIGAGEQPVL